MMGICDASVVAGYDRRRSRFSDAAVIRKYDNNRDHRDIASHSSIIHIAYPLHIQGSKTTYLHIYISTYSHIHMSTYSNNVLPTDQCSEPDAPGYQYKAPAILLI